MENLMENFQSCVRGEIKNFSEKSGRAEFFIKIRDFIWKPPYIRFLLRFRMQIIEISDENAKLSRKNP